MVEDYSIGLYEKALPAELSWEQRFAKALEAGYEFLELSIDETDQRLSRLDWGKAQCLEFIELQYELGFRVPTMCLSGLRRYPIGSHSREVRETGMEVLNKAIRLASKLGIRIIQVAGYDVLPQELSTSESAGRFRKNLGTALSWAESCGVTLGIENMGVVFMDSLVKIMKYVNDFQSPYLQVYADVGNLKAMQKHIPKELTHARGHIAAVHIKDTVKGVCRDIPFSQGEVDFFEVFSVLRKIGYRGMLLVEMWNQPDIDNLKEVKDAYSFVSGHIKTAESNQANSYA